MFAIIEWGWCRIKYYFCFHWMPDCWWHHWKCLYDCNLFYTGKRLLNRFIKSLKFSLETLNGFNSIGILVGWGRISDVWLAVFRSLWQFASIVDLGFCFFSLIVLEQLIWHFLKRGMFETQWVFFLVNYWIYVNFQGKVVTRTIFAMLTFSTLNATKYNATFYITFQP